ncbi:MAG TPA: hypothetical protein VGH19_17470 [Verrucomicrobiae bacterium]
MARVYRWNQKRQLRSQGIYPQAGQASMADVERLVKMGHRIEAIVCYRELFPHAGLAEAKEAVDALAR